MEWVDNSPYAYQRWYTAIDQPNDVSKIFFSDGVRRAALNLKFLLPPKIQPVASFDHRCTAVLAQFSVGLEWIKVPCNQSISNTYFVCEIKLNTTKNNVSTQYRSIYLPYIGCPAKMLQFNSSCMRGLSVPSINTMFMEDLCIREKMDFFQLPQSLDTKTKDQHFLVDLLVSMTHRWPNKADDDSELSDTIIASYPSTHVKGHIGSIGLVAVQFSEMLFSHVQVANLSEAAPGNSMYVTICSQPMVVVRMGCLPGHSVCNDRTCVLSHYFCDGITDSSDEEGCSHVCSSVDTSRVNMHCFTNCTWTVCVCHDLYFQCPLGGCVPWSRVCDGVPDCGQGEDEHFCVSLLKQKGQGHVVFPWIHPVSTRNIYNCLDGPNISVAYKNDLVPDCPLQDDEQAFGEFLRQGRKLDFFSDETLCDDSDETTCVKGYKGVCYPRHLYCIHEPYQHQAAVSESPLYKRHICRNGGHLINCERHSCPSPFKCPSAFCIPTHAICNGRADCPNGEDEEECKPLSCPGMLLCRHDHVCVYPYDVRSGHIKCPLSTDKALANVALCPVQCLCHGNAVLCDHVSHLKITHLPPDIRLIILRRSKTLLDHVTWQKKRSFTLRLEVSWCNISTVKSSYFRQFHSLKELSLQHNIISYLADRVFHSLVNLESLDLSYNNVTHLQREIFEGALRLKVIKLQYNNLISIAACTFGDLHSLKFLNLSNNMLTHFGDNIVCSHMVKSIKELDLSQNNFRLVDPTIHGIQSPVLSLKCHTITNLLLCSNDSALLPKKEICNFILQSLACTKF